MEEMLKLLKICKEYLEESTDVEEFQKRIETIVLPEKCSKKLKIVLFNAHEKLEEIICCYDASRRKYANVVAQVLINETEVELKRFAGCNMKDVNSII